MLLLRQMLWDWEPRWPSLEEKMQITLQVEGVEQCFTGTRPPALVKRHPIEKAYRGGSAQRGRPSRSVRIHKWPADRTALAS